MLSSISKCMEDVLGVACMVFGVCSLAIWIETGKMMALMMSLVAFGVGITRAFMCIWSTDDNFSRQEDSTRDRRRNEFSSTHNGSFLSRSMPTGLSVLSPIKGEDNNKVERNLVAQMECLPGDRASSSSRSNDGVTPNLEAVTNDFKHYAAVNELSGCTGPVWTRNRVLDAKDISEEEYRFEECSRGKFEFGSGPRKSDNRTKSVFFANNDSGVEVPEHDESWKKIFGELAKSISVLSKSSVDENNNRTYGIAVPKPNKLNQRCDFETWKTQFMAYVQHQRCSEENRISVLLAFVDDAIVKDVKRSVAKRVFDNWESLFQCIEPLFVRRDINPEDLIGHLTRRHQFADESLFSYMNDLLDWTERIRQIHLLPGYDAESNAMARFITGLHDNDLKIAVRKFFKRSANSGLSSEELLGYARDMEEEIGISNCYFATYRTCKEYACPLVVKQDWKQNYYNPIRDPNKQLSTNGTINSVETSHEQKNIVQSNLMPIQHNKVMAKVEKTADTRQANYSGYNRSRVRCYGCNETGHIRAFCPRNRSKSPRRDDKYRPNSNQQVAEKSTSFGNGSSQSQDARINSLDPRTMMDQEQTCNGSDQKWWSSQ